MVHSVGFPLHRDHKLWYARRPFGRQPDKHALNLETAIALAEPSAFLRSVLQPDSLTILLQQAKRELAFVGNQVTPVEQDRYLGNF